MNKKAAGDKFMTSIVNKKMKEEEKHIRESAAMKSHLTESIIGRHDIDEESNDIYCLSNIEEIKEANRFITSKEIAKLRRVYTDTNLKRFIGIDDEQLENIHAELINIRDEHLGFLQKIGIKARSFFYTNKYLSSLFPAIKVIESAQLLGTKTREGLVCIHGNCSASYHYIYHLWLHQNAG